MPGSVEQIGLVSASLDAAAVRLLPRPREVRVVEEVCTDRAERDWWDRCPLEACCPEVTPPPFSCYLEDRNVREVAAYTFSEYLKSLPRADLFKVADCPREPERCEAPRAGGHEKQVVRESKEMRPAPADPALRGPRLGDVSPVQADVMQRRLRVVYREAVVVGGSGRIDLIG